MNEQTTHQNTNQMHSDKIPNTIYLLTKSGSIIMDEPVSDIMYRKRYFAKNYAKVPDEVLVADTIIIDNVRYQETHNRPVTLPVNVNHRRFTTVTELFEYLTRSAGYRTI